MKKDIFCALFAIQKARIQRHTMQERAGVYAYSHACEQNKAREE